MAYIESKFVGSSSRYASSKFVVSLGWATSSTTLHLILIELNVSSHIEIIKAQSSFQELLSKQKFKIKNVEAFVSSLILLKSIFCFVLFCFARRRNRRTEIFLASCF